MNQTSLKHDITITMASELARALFPVESANYRNEVTNHIFIGDGCIWEEISFANTCWVSQSVSVLSSFKCSF